MGRSNTIKAQGEEKRSDQTHQNRLLLHLCDKEGDSGFKKTVMSKRSEAHMRILDPNLEQLEEESFNLSREEDELVENEKIDNLNRDPPKDEKEIADKEPNQATISQENVDSIQKDKFESD